MSRPPAPVLLLASALLFGACTGSTQKSPCVQLQARVSTLLAAVADVEAKHRAQSGSYASRAVLEDKLPSIDISGLSLDVLRSDADGYLVELRESAPPPGQAPARWYIDQRRAIRSRDNRCKKARQRALIDVDGVVREAFGRAMPVKSDVVVYESQRSLSGEGQAAFVLTLDGQTLATWIDSRAAKRFTQERPPDEVKRALALAEAELQRAEVWADVLDGADLAALLEDERVLWRVEREGDESVRVYLVDLTGCTFVFLDVDR